MKTIFFGAGVSFNLTYIVIIFLWMLHRQNTEINISLAQALLSPIIPALFMSFVGGIVGRMAAGFPRSDHAALIGGALFVAYVGIPSTAIGYFSGYFLRSFYFTAISAAMGAIVGGTAMIVNRRLTDPHETGKWPRFYLSELLTGFFLMAVIFACLTALVRHPT
jgi:hypothetical protein